MEEKRREYKSSLEHHSKVDLNVFPGHRFLSQNVVGMYHYRLTYFDKVHDY